MSSAGRGVVIGGVDALAIRIDDGAGVDAQHGP